MIVLVNPIVPKDCLARKKLSSKLIFCVKILVMNCVFTGATVAVV